MASTLRSTLGLLWWVSVVSVVLCCLPSPGGAQGAKPGASTMSPGVDDVQKNLEEIRKVSAKLGTVIDTATKQLAGLAECKDPRQCGVKIDELFTNMRTEVLNVFDKLGSNSDLMDAVARAKESIIVLKQWYANQPPEYLQREATIKDLEAQIAHLDQAVERIRDGRVMAQEQLKGLMLQQQVISDQIIRGRVRAAVEAVQAVVGEMGNLSKALDTVANVNVRSPVRVAQ